MSWEQFIYFAIAAILLWAIGAWAAWKEKTGIAYTATIVGLVVFFSFILSMWIILERPPLRTMGETRLWYSFFLPLAGIIVYSRWKYKWILTFSTILALVFICVSRHCLYVRIRRTWCSYGDGRLSAFHQKENDGKH